MARRGESELAWELASSVGSVLHSDLRLLLWTKIGAGEEKRAIEDLLRFSVGHGIEMEPHLFARVLDWIDGYRGSDREMLLRKLAARIRIAGLPSDDCLDKTSADVSEYHTRHITVW
jgi:hypothetical protein